MGQLSLAIVERPEAFGFELECARYVQSVQSANAQPGAVTASQVRTRFPGQFRHACLGPQSRRPIMFHIKMNLVRLGGGYLALENMLRNGVRPFRVMERRKPDNRARGHASFCFQGVLIRHVE